MASDRFDPKRLTETAINYLLTTLESRPTGRQMHVGVSAAKSLLEHTRAATDPTELLVSILGDEEAALDWIQEVAPKLQARVEAKRAKLAASEERGRRLLKAPLEVEDDDDE